MSLYTHKFNAISLYYSFRYIFTNEILPNPIQIGHFTGILLRLLGLIFRLDVEMQENNVSQQLQSWMFWPTMIIASGASIVLILLYKYQNKMLYHPSIPGLPLSPDDNPEGFRHPGERNVPYEDVMIETADERKVHS